MALAVPPDLELFVIGYLADQLAARGHDTIVTNREPADLTIETVKPVIVCRDDGGPQTEAVTYSRSLGVTVYAGTRQDEKTARDLAGLVYALAAGLDIATAPGSPIAAVNYMDGNVGPYRDPEYADRAAYYMSFQYAIVATLID